ncbi:type III-B CRISPR-associated protein Cas10/Cmr2 [Paenibacillus albidus]|uniref:type III-B CRISPR-associated protein Cas10/Cmr2 n=1 Tax=Paenibacillus albidus TaxID=2041023 RepID=UPI001BEC826C|nr:type III-B CRISPR-associated protein Cas10/Cmr2 [Paenibacillus albidus]MBT2288281.1 type III-B CRISPR-associated protein Cas10/Cmr2 [Paenibacillus albidus]
MEEAVREEIQESIQLLQSAGPKAQVVMLISIGPVQEFIAQARKTRDLWFGSYVLSEVSKAAAVRLADEHKARLIFPYIGADKNVSELDNLKVANKVLAIVDTDNPKAIALDVRRAAALKWLEYAEQAKAKLGSSVIGPMWERQVKDFIELYIVWSELDKEGNYKEVLKKTERLMSARKTLRDFRPNEPADRFGDNKSGLDSGRESVLKPDKYSEYARFGIKYGETLDAISLVKRMSQFIGNEREFKSVCELAFQQFRDEMGHPENGWMKKEVDDYYQNLQEKYNSELNLKGNDLNSYDSQMFYASRVEEAVMELAADRLKPVLLDRARQVEITKDIQVSLEKLYDRINKCPTPYYALVVGDGDRMGDVLRRMKTSEEHQKFTGHLSSFATQVDEIVCSEDIKGQMIYSGGDDLMALLPVHRCLEAVKEIQNKFMEIMSKALPDAEQRPTLSIGIAIVHMFEPLEEALGTARATESLAKVRRDELAIHFQKRSGSEEMRVSLPFAENPVDTIFTLQALYKKDLISTSFAYGLRQLHAEYKKLKSAGAVQSEGLGELLHLEIRRLILLKKPGHITKDEALDEVLKIFDDLKSTGADSAREPLALLNRLAEQCVIAVTLEKVGRTHGTNDTDSTA